MLMHQLLLDAAMRDGDKLAFRWVDRDKTLTRAEAVAQMERMAGALHELGVRKGSVRAGVLQQGGVGELITGPASGADRLQAARRLPGKQGLDVPGSDPAGVGLFGVQRG